MDRTGIGSALREIGARLRLAGDNPFRARAYEAGAEAIESLSDGELKLRLEHRTLTAVPGIGAALAAVVAELAASGRTAVLDRLRAMPSASLLELTQLRGITRSSRCAVEISGDPYRLGLPPSWIPSARRRGIRFVISTDAHAVADLDNVPYGVAMARRGGVRRLEVLNTLPVAAFRAAVHP